MTTSVELELFTSSFCGACRRARGVLATAQRYLPDLAVTEHPIKSEPDRAVAAGIETTPTVIIRDRVGAELFRASGVPTIDQVLTAIVHATGPTSKENPEGRSAPGSSTNSPR